MIDELIERTPSISGKLIDVEGIFSRGQGEFGKQMNDFVKSLSREQRGALAIMLNSVRQGAIGDVLSMFTWWTSCRGLSLAVHGEPMPVDLSGMGLHGDYIGRLEGRNWPKDTEVSGPE